jgi:UPF0176 protein
VSTGDASLVPGTAATQVAAFYKFVALPDFAALRAPLLAVAQDHGVKGTILLAPEGINSTIAGSRAGLDAVINYLRRDMRFADLVVKYSTAAGSTFGRLKVRLKREIVTLGQPQADPTRQVGTYVAAADWNSVISAPDVLLVDTRNAYEVEIGSFAGAVNPHTSTFTEFPAFVAAQLSPAKPRKIAMFCTGGIRCEKASSYLLSQGFEEVYHLEGGILKYLETVSPADSLWRGECYVFDQRVALTHGLGPGSYDACRACGKPILAAPISAAGDPTGAPCPHCDAAEAGHQDRTAQREHAKKSPNKRSGTR